MAYEQSSFSGNETFCINCTGDAVVGDEVCFERATFSGSFKNPKFNGFEMIIGKIIRDSYGADKQQHTFTILVEGGGHELKIKGRNLYKNGIWRKPWEFESKRYDVALEKHARGAIARSARASRMESMQF